MPTNQKLPPGQQPVLRPHYPHMLQEDNSVWSKFLSSDADRISELWYDLKVGEPIFLSADATEMERKIANGVSRKRIDVVCHVEENYWVVEIKPLASMLAIGQALTYARLFALEYEVVGRVVPVIVCDYIDADLVDEFDEFGILVLANEENV